MGIFRTHKPTTAFAKVGIMGFAGSGKTYTATIMAIGLHKLLVSREIIRPDKPVDFLDTETGSDWVARQFDAEGIRLRVARSRAFTDLLAATSESKHILIIDSITHFWRELTESYKAAYKQRVGRPKKSLTFGDWATLKEQWGRFTDAYVNSRCHIIMCGRAGFEYDMYRDDNSEWQVRKSGVKMSTEKETAFEPSLLIRMDRRQVDTDAAHGYQLCNTAVVIKDRSDKLNGLVKDAPTFQTFLPHFECINFGGRQVGVDTSRTSSDLVSPLEEEKPGSDDRKAAVLGDIEGLLIKYFPGQTKEHKSEKVKLLERHFGHPGWTAVTQLGLEPLEKGLATLAEQLEKDDPPF